MKKEFKLKFNQNCAEYRHSNNHAICADELSAWFNYPEGKPLVGILSNRKMSNSYWLELSKEPIDFGLAHIFLNYKITLVHEYFYRVIEKHFPNGCYARIEY